MQQKQIFHTKSERAKSMFFGLSISAHGGWLDFARSMLSCLSDGGSAHSDQSSLKGMHSRSHLHVCALLSTFVWTVKMKSTCFTRDCCSLLMQLASCAPLSPARTALRSTQTAMSSVKRGLCTAKTRLSRVAAERLSKESRSHADTAASEAATN